MATGIQPCTALAAAKVAAPFRAAPASRTLHQQQRRHAAALRRGSATAAPRRRPAAAVPTTAAASPAALVGEVGVREEKLEGSGVRLHVTLPAEAVQRQYQALMVELRKGTSVPGYRKGKVPDPVIVEHVGGMARMANSVLSELLEPAVAQAMRPYEGVAVPDSERIEQAAEELEARFSLGSDFCFTLHFDALPPITWLTPYSQLEVTVETGGDEATDAAAAGDKLLSLRKGQAKLRVVADRGLEPGDLAIVDFSASRVDTGEELLGASRSSMRLDTDDADTTFLPGIVAIMGGMRPGEERVAPLTFPTDETFQPAPLRGVEASVRIKMTELFSYDLPELTDEWANSLLPGGGLDGLLQRLLENQRAEREAETQERIKDAFQAAVGRAVSVEVPESLLNELGGQQYSVSLNRMLSQGLMTYEMVQQLATPELVKQFVSSRRQELVEMQSALLGFDDIAVKEGLRPTEEEIEVEFKEAAGQFGQYQQEYDAERLRDQVFETVQANKVMNWLTTNCKVTMVNSVV